jgi:hypothetical protein
VAGDWVSVLVGETAVTVQAQISDKAPVGLVLLSGVPYFAGTAVAQISKLEKEGELA